MKNLTENNDDLLLANLALHLGKVKDHSVGPIPSDEDLLALADNSLDEIRRAQVMSHIACNSIIYHKWISSVQAIAAFQPAAREAALDYLKVDTKPGILQKLSSWIFGNNLRAGAFGGALASIFVAVFAIMLLPSMDDLKLLDSEYQKWNTAIDGRWKDINPINKQLSKSSGSRAFRFATEEQNLIKYGYQSGAKNIGLKYYQSLGIPVAKLVGKQPDKSTAIKANQYDSLLTLGRLTALTTLQCELQASDEEMNPIRKLLTQVSLNLSHVDDQEIKTAVTTFHQSSRNSDDMCGLTDKVLRIIF